jgi:hypothetical protein
MKLSDVPRCVLSVSLAFLICFSVGYAASGSLDQFVIVFRIESRFTQGELRNLVGKRVISVNKRYESSDGEIVGYEEFGRRNQIMVRFERHGVLRNATVRFNKEAFAEYLRVVE